MSNVSAARRQEPALCGAAYHPVKSCRECDRIWRHRRASHKRTMPTKAVGPECPECGSTDSRSLARGWSEPDDNFLRRRRCLECNEVFVTAEVVVPTDNTSFYRLDYRGREWRREHYRATKAKTDMRLAPYRSDYLHIKVRVAPRERPNVCSRGHTLTPENTYVYPNGTRNCRTCRRTRQRRYYEERAA